MLVAGSTSPSSSPSPSFASFSSGRTVAWWKESSSSPSPSSIVVPQAPSPSPRYGGLQRSMAIGRGAVQCTQDQDLKEEKRARFVAGPRKLQAIPEALSVRRTVKTQDQLQDPGDW
ncbi:hypothetical protein EYR38_001525 [Pleurotus pulmonarius]|nr:hypothetical protein EYR38_001525 [Pleurotus pulmonarius]